MVKLLVKEPSAVIIWVPPVRAVQYPLNVYVVLFALSRVALVTLALDVVTWVVAPLSVYIPVAYFSYILATVVVSDELVFLFNVIVNIFGVAQDSPSYPVAQVHFAYIVRDDAEFHAVFANVYDAPATYCVPPVPPSAHLLNALACVGFVKPLLANVHVAAVEVLPVATNFWALLQLVAAVEPLPPFAL